MRSPEPRISTRNALPGEGTAGSATDSAIGVAKGHSMVVGMIAFDAGWLLSSLLPTTSTKRELCSTVKEKAVPLGDAVEDAVKDTVQRLRKPAKDAAVHLKEPAQDAAGTVKQAEQSTATDVRSTAADAKDGVIATARRNA